MQKEDFLNDLINSLKRYHPEKVMLIGSYARGNSDSYSDIDLIIIKKTSDPFIKRLEDIVQYLNIPGKTIQAFIYTPKEFKMMRQMHNPFLSHTLKDSKVIYEKPS
jgi:predicted nucleotidyltransferase